MVCTIREIFEVFIITFVTQHDLNLLTPLSLVPLLFLLLSSSSFSSSASFSSSYIVDIAPSSKNVTSAPVLCLAMNRAGLYAGVGAPDCVLRLLVLNQDSSALSEVTDVHRMPGPVSNLNFNFEYNRLAVGSSCGRLDILSAGADVSTKTLIDIQSGRFEAIGAVMSPDGVTRYCAVRRRRRRK